MSSAVVNTPGTQDIVAFLAARFDELEAAANGADRTSWRQRMRARGLFDAVDVRAYVLADIAAKRRILAEHAEREIASLERHDWGRVHRVCRSCMLPGERSVVHPCPTIRLLAAPFVSHADFDTDWSVSE